MKISLNLTIFFLFAILFGTGMIVSIDAFAETKFEDKEYLKNYAPDTLLVKFKTNVNENLKKSIIEQNDAITISEIPQIQVKILKVPEHTLDKVMFALSHNTNVEFVEKDYFFEPSLIPNDPKFSSQWHLQNIQADLAWDVTIGSTSIPIAILDTGVDVNHPDLADKLQFGYNFYDNNSDLTDICGHGTKVAGTAAASSNNSLGVAGVAWDNPIIPIKITDSNCYGYYSTMSKGIIYAADHGARVANISFGIYGGNSLNAAAQYMQEKGGWVVAAGGNSGDYENYDDNPYLISVGATSSSDVKTSWSSYGEYIDFAAPGSGIYTTKTGGSYGSASGTSFSSPIVAGAIALLFSFDPTLTPEQVYDALKSSALDLGETGRDNYYGWGKINVYEALQSIETPNSPVDTEPPVISGIPSDITIDTNVSSGIVVTWIEPTATDNVGVISFDSTHNSGDTFPVGSTTVTYTASDAAGNSDDSSFTVTVTYIEPPPVDTIPPVVSITSPSDGETVKRKVTLSASATDASGISVVKFYVDGNLVSSDSSYPYNYSWNTRHASSGLHVISAEAFDMYGNNSIDSIDIEIAKKGNSKSKNR